MEVDADEVGHAGFGAHVKLQDGVLPGCMVRQGEIPGEGRLSVIMGEKHVRSLWGSVRSTAFVETPGRGGIEFGDEIVVGRDIARRLWGWSAEVEPKAVAAGGHGETQGGGVVGFAWCLCHDLEDAVLIASGSDDGNAGRAVGAGLAKACEFGQVDGKFT